MILIFHFLKKTLDEILRLNVFKGIVLSLKSSLPSTCKIEKIQNLFYLRAYMEPAFKVFGGICLKGNTTSEFSL